MFPGHRVRRAGRSLYDVSPAEQRAAERELRAAERESARHAFLDLSAKLSSASNTARGDGCTLQGRSPKRDEEWKQNEHGLARRPPRLEPYP